MSTIAVATADAVAAKHATRGQRYFSAPVFGRPEAAAAGKLFVVTAGDAADIARARPVLEAVGQRVFEVGERPSAANLVKLCGNFAILAAIETMGEAMALAEKGGVDKAKLIEVLTGTLFDAPVYRTYGPILVNERFRPAGFAAPLGFKDMRLAGEAAEKSVTPMPLLSLLGTASSRPSPRRGRTSTGRRLAGPAPGTPAFEGPPPPRFWEGESAGRLYRRLAPV